MVAAIDSQATCTSVGGVYSAATCQLLTQPVCDQAQGSWQPRKRDSLEGGMDLLYVGLLQASAWSSFLSTIETRHICCAYRPSVCPAEADRTLFLYVWLIQTELTAVLAMYAHYIRMSERPACLKHC